MAKAINFILLILFASVIFSLLGVDNNFKNKNSFFILISILLVCLAILMFSIYGLSVIEPLTKDLLNLIGISTDFFSDYISVALTLIPPLAGVFIKNYREMKGKNEKNEKIIIEKEKLGLRYEPNGTESEVYKIVVMRKSK